MSERLQHVIYYKKQEDVLIVYLDVSLTVSGSFSLLALVMYFCNATATPAVVGLTAAN